MCIRVQSITMAKTNVQFDILKRIEAEKNEYKDEKLINNEQIKEQ